jgi:catechol 2,3-dioxygenase-like lactoylglutathione lyase family enzyme
VNITAEQRPSKQWPCVATTTEVPVSLIVVSDYHAGMRVHHLAFRTKDLARLERFYVDVVGLTVRARQGERSVWLDADGTIVMIERAPADEPPVANGTMELVAFEITEQARAMHEARLAAYGVVIEARTAFTIYFRDPDGRRVGLSHFI